MKTFWSSKRKTSNSISNEFIENIYNILLLTGASNGKISETGGGGFMMLFVSPLKRMMIKKVLSYFPGKFMNFYFFYKVANSWKVSL